MNHARDEWAYLSRRDAIGIPIMSVIVNIAATSSHAEDRGVGMARDLPPHLINQVKELLQRITPEGQTLSKNEARTVFEFSFLERVIKTHGIDKIGMITEQSRPRVEPVGDGFNLRLIWRETAGNDRAGAAIFGRIVPRQACKSYQNFYKLPNNRGFVELALHFGSAADASVLESLQAELSTVGQQVYMDAPDEWDTESVMLWTRIINVTSKQHSEAKMLREDRRLTCLYRTLDYDIYEVDGEGRIAAEPHRETGPRPDGFLIRLTPHEETVGIQPSNMYGLARGPYWQKFFTTHGSFLLEVLYGVDTDKELLEKVITAFDPGIAKRGRF